MYKSKDSPRYRIKDSPEDVAMQEEIRSRANYSLAILGMSFYHRCGRFLNIRMPDRTKNQSLEDRV